MVVFAGGRGDGAGVGMGDVAQTAGDPFLSLRLQLLEEVEFSANHCHLDRQCCNRLSFAVTHSALSLILRFCSLFANLSYSLQIGSAGGDESIGLSEIEAEKEVNSGVLPAEGLKERCEFRVADFIKVDELLLIKAHSGRPVLNKRVGFGLRIEVITQQFDD